MKKSVMKNMKFFIAAALIILVVGMTLFGVLGLNQTVDYKNGYELNIAVDQDAGGSVDAVKTATEDYLSDKDVSYSVWDHTQMNEGRTLIYKFSEDYTQEIEGLEEELRAVLDDKDLQAVGVTVKFYELKDDVKIDAWMPLAAAGVAIAVIFVYALIMEKLAASVAVIVSAVVAPLLFVAMLGITRIPANPFVSIGVALAMIIGAGLSITTVRRLKEESKNVANEKLSYTEIADKVAPLERAKYVLVTASIAVGAIALAATGSLYMMVAGLQLLVAGVVGTFTSYFMTPLLWSAIKGSKK